MDKKDKFDAMLALAEFGANRMERRGSIEFQIFISYTTLIVIGLYVIITKNTDVVGVLKNISAMLLCTTLVLINIIYIIWQVGLGRAMQNDAVRRNYYVKKAQDLTDRSPPENPRGKRLENSIIVNGHYLHQFCDLHLIVNHWSRFLLIGIPTLLHAILLYEVSKLTNYSTHVFVISILIPISLIVVGIIMEIWRRYRKTEENTNA